MRALAALLVLSAIGLAAPAGAAEGGQTTPARHQQEASATTTGECNELGPGICDVWTRRRFAIEAHAGEGTPVGVIGGVVEYSLSSAVALGLGAGTGLRDLGAPFYGALVARFRAIASEHNALVLGTAYSVNAREAHEAWLHWLQADLGWEGRTEMGFLVRLTVGTALLLNPGSAGCAFRVDGQNVCDPPEKVTLLPTWDLAVGYSF